MFRDVALFEEFDAEGFSVFGRFDLAALCGCRTQMFVMLCYVNELRSMSSCPTITARLPARETFAVLLASDPAVFLDAGPACFSTVILH